MFHLEIEPSTLSVASEDLAKQIDDLLKEIIAEKLHFEDATDFLTWAQDSFPFIRAKKDPLSKTVHIIIFSHFSPEFCADYYSALLKKKLPSQKDFSGLSMRHFDFSLRGIHNKRFCLIETKISEQEIDESYVASLKMLIKQTFSDTQPSKEMLVQQRLLTARRRFHQWLEGSVLEEMKCLFALASREFIEQRSFRFLTRLILSQHFMQKTLIKSAINTPEVCHAVCRLLSARLVFPFTSKTVLGVFVGVSFVHKYDFFSEEHLLRAIQKLVPESQWVPESIYAFQRYGNPFRFIYIEIEKKGGGAFSVDERRLLSLSLAQEVKWSVEKLQPSVFMVTNEEEVAKNILVLSREVSSISDLPQVMIHFEKQTEKGIEFRIIMVGPSKEKQLCLEKKFKTYSASITYVLDRVRTVRHLKKKCPVQAQVFKLCLSKNPKFLRSDASLNFYAARSQICEFLVQVIGPFRDYNGGIILKQGERLEEFKRLFRDYPSDLIENFFYGLTPIETQASISLETIAALFELFLEGRNHNLIQKTDHFVKFFQKNNQTYCIFRAQDSSAYKFLKEATKETAGYHDNLIYTQIWYGESHFYGCIFESQDPLHHTYFSKQLLKGIESWKSKLESLKTLRLTMSSTPLSLDPRIQGGEDKNAILKLLFDGLTCIDHRGKIILAVAKSVAISRDKKTYTFHLRTTFWSNNTPVIADDFVYAWKTVLSPHFKTPCAYLFYSIKNAEAVKEGKLHSDLLGVRAIDDHTLEVELTSPTPYFLELLSLPQFFPVNKTIDLIEPSWPTQQGEKFICNGAFVFKESHPIRGYEFVKNPFYSNKKAVQLDSITIKKARVSEIKEMFLQDQIDWVGFPMDFLNFPPLPRTTGEPIIVPNEALHWYVFNTQRFPFNYPKLRQALALVINRVRILQQMPPGSWPALTILALHQSRASPMEENREKGIELFNEALQELNLNTSTFPVIKIVYTEGGIRSSIAKSIQEEWEKTLGVRCCIEAYKWHSLFAKLIEGDFQVGALDWIALIDDPSYTLEIFRKTNTWINFPKWHNAQYEHFLDKARSKTKKQQRLACYALAEEILIQEAAVIPILRTLPQSIKKNRVKLLQCSPQKSWDFKWTTIQTSKNKEIIHG